MDYAHARHAGNAGDVHKHVALVALLEELTRRESPLTYVETHAGDGLYPLSSVGEWGAGAQKVLADGEGLVGRYAGLLRRHSPGEKLTRYPGSPVLARELLRPADRLVLCEIDPRSAGLLRRAVPSADVRETDGFAALPGLAGQAALALIDPPYTDKHEWTKAAEAMIAARATAPGCALALWYPIKALTRPRALIAALARGGVHGLAVELHWTPLRLQRDRLNGSGLVLSGCPRPAVEACLASLSRLGEALNTHGEWHGAQIGF